MKHETLHHESIPETSHNLKAAQRREAPLILSQSPCLHVLQFQQQPDRKPRNGKGRCPGTCRDLAALTQLLWPPSPSLPCHSARQWAWKVTWLQQQACCGGCWCLIWLAASSWGIWGEADRRLHLTSSEISSKEEPGRSSGDGEGAECLMHVPTYLWVCDGVSPGLLGLSQSHAGLLVFVFPAKAIRPKRCRSWTRCLALSPELFSPPLLEPVTQGLTLPRWLSPNKAPQPASLLKPVPRRWMPHGNPDSEKTAVLSSSEFLQAPLLTVSQLGGSPCSQVMWGTLTHCHCLKLASWISERWEFFFFFILLWLSVALGWGLWRGMWTHWKATQKSLSDLFGHVQAF